MMGLLGNNTWNAFPVNQSMGAGFSSPYPMLGQDNVGFGMASPYGADMFTPSTDLLGMNTGMYSTPSYLGAPQFGSMGGQGNVPGMAYSPISGGPGMTVPYGPCNGFGGQGGIEQMCQMAAMLMMAMMRMMSQMGQNGGTNPYLCGGGYGYPPAGGVPAGGMELGGLNGLGGMPSFGGLNGFGGMPSFGGTLPLQMGYGAPASFGTSSMPYFQNGLQGFGVSPFGNSPYGGTPLGTMSFPFLG